MKLSKQKSLSLSEFPRGVEVLPRTKVINKQCIERGIKASERGRSMVEMLGVLAIIGVLTVGGIAGYSKAMQKYKINKTIDQITQTIANVQTLYAQQSTYDGVYSVKNQVVPQEAGNFLTVGTVNGANNIFGVGYYGMCGAESYQYCIAMASMDWKSSLGDSLIGITVATFALHDYSDRIDVYLKSIKEEVYQGYYVGANHLPLSLNEAAEYCQNGGGWSNVSNDCKGFTIYIGK